jgi:protein-tyrosine-phosphatase
MAEGLLRHELEGRGCDDVEIASAGTWAARGEPPTQEAIAVSKRDGIDLSSHRSQPVEAGELDATDLVITMTNMHLQEVSSVLPEARSKTLLLKELVQIERPPLWPDATVEERVGALLGGVRPKWRRKLDVADPIGRPMRFYERCFAELRDGVEALADVLCPEEVQP